MLGRLNLLLYPPLTASGAPFRSPMPLPGCPAGTNGSSPLKDLKRPQASATYLTPPPPVRPGLLFPRMPRSQGGLEGSLLSLPLPASHWTYNSGTEPGSCCPPNLVLGGDKPRRARDPPPQIWKAERLASWHFLVLALALALPFSSSSMSLLQPFILLSLSIFPSISPICGSESQLLSLLGLPCPTLAQGRGGRVSHPNHPLCLFSSCN